MADACINCGTTLTGKYCANCGQSADTHRYDFKLIVKDFFDVFYKFKSSIFHSIRLSFTHPVRSINNYLEGKRIEFYSPFRYVFFISVLNSFLMIKLVNVTMETIFANEPYSERIFKTYMNNMTIVDMLEIPIVSLFTFLFFRKRKLNYSENLVANCFIYGNIFFVNIFVVIIQWIFNFNLSIVSAIDDINMIFITVYPMFIYVKLFEQNLVSGIFKSLIAVLLAKGIYITLVMSYLVIFG